MTCGRFLSFHHVCRLKMSHDELARRLSAAATDLRAHASAVTTALARLDAASSPHASEAARLRRECHRRLISAYECGCGEPQLLLLGEHSALRVLIEGTLLPGLEAAQGDALRARLAATNDRLQRVHALAGARDAALGDTPSLLSRLSLNRHSSRNAVVVSSGSSASATAASNPQATLAAHAELLDTASWVVDPMALAGQDPSVAVWKKRLALATSRLDALTSAVGVGGVGMKPVPRAVRTTTLRSLLAAELDAELGRGAADTECDELLAVLEQHVGGGGLHPCAKWVPLLVQRLHLTTLLRGGGGSTPPLRR